MPRRLASAPALHHCASSTARAAARGQIRPRYTARVKDLTTELGYLGGSSIYSGVAHAELAGV